MSNIISVKNLTFCYDGDEPNQKGVLRNLNLEIEQGTFTVILGHNGSGKSTLAKLLNGLLKPDSGTVTVDGLSTTDPQNEFEIRRRVGLIFQNPDNQLVCSVVEEDVAFGPENIGIEPEEIKTRVADALSAVNMAEYRQTSLQHLSGGQKQRVAIAGILAMQPECIVLDEPTAMLDPVGRREVINTITELNKKYGITIVLITHYMEEAQNADRVIVMDSGKIVANDQPEKVFQNTELIKKAGLMLPQTTELLATLNQNGMQLPTGIISPSKAAEAIFAALQSGEVAP